MLLQEHGLSLNQLHGLDIQDQLSHAFAGRPVPDPHTQAWDIPASFDPYLALPTSIKTVACRGAPAAATVGMSDARRTFGIAHPYRLLVAPYRQTSHTKVVEQVFEFLIEPAEMDRICGDLTYEHVEAFHEGLLGFAPGQHVAGRQWARTHKRELLSERSSGFILNPKVGNADNARRLQCSIRLGTLMSQVAQWRVHQGSFYGLPLPLVITSSARQFNAV